MKTVKDGEIVPFGLSKYERSDGNGYFISFPLLVEWANRYDYMSNRKITKKWRYVVFIKTNSWLIPICIRASWA